MNLDRSDSTLVNHLKYAASWHIESGYIGGNYSTELAQIVWHSVNRLNNVAQRTIKSRILDAITTAESSR